MLCPGEMSDAAEVLMAIYEHLLPVAAEAGQPQLLNFIFGLHVQVAPAHTNGLCHTLL